MIQPSTLATAVRGAGRDFRGHDRIGDGEGERAVGGGGHAGDRALAADHPLRRGAPAGRADAIHGQRAGVLRGEGEPRAVGGPDGGEVERSARAVEGVGEAPRRAALHRHREDPRVPTEFVPVAPSEVGQAPPIG
jgi:hypothetical protein